MFNFRWSFANQIENMEKHQGKKVFDISDIFQNNDILKSISFSAMPSALTIFSETIKIIIDARAL